MGHVNNAVFLTYLEEARLAFLRPLGTDQSAMILARAEIDFRAPVRIGQQIEIGVRPLRVGEKSFDLEYALEVDGHRVADAKTVLVSYDYEAGQAVAVPSAWRESLIA